MFLEKCGKCFFQSMRTPFFYTLLLFPLIASGLYLHFESSSIQELQSRFSIAASKQKSAYARKERKERFLDRYSKANPYFINQKIESIPLLENEHKKIESILRHPAFPSNPILIKRLEFLSHNKLSFVEESIETSSSVKETHEKLRNCVQMDEQDLQKILSLLEDIPINSSTPSNESPQILIKDFKLKKQKTPLQSEVFEVEMDLIKREFIK